MSPAWRARCRGSSAAIVRARSPRRRGEQGQERPAWVPVSTKVGSSRPHRPARRVPRRMPIARMVADRAPRRSSRRSSGSRQVARASPARGGAAAHAVAETVAGGAADHQRGAVEARHARRRPRHPPLVARIALDRDQAAVAPAPARRARPSPATVSAPPAMASPRRWPTSPVDHDAAALERGADPVEARPSRPRRGSRCDRSSIAKQSPSVSPPAGADREPGDLGRRAAESGGRRDVRRSSRSGGAASGEGERRSRAAGP